MDETVRVDDAQRRRLGQFTRHMNLLCSSGIWCGDCVRQGPILHHLAAAANAAAGTQVVDLRFVERVDDSELADELRILGALRVPVTVCLSEDFHEVGRTGDRMLVTYRRKAQRELGAACDVGLVPPPDAEVSTEVEQWLDHLERMQWMLRLSPPLRAATATEATRPATRRRTGAARMPPVFTPRAAVHRHAVGGVARPPTNPANQVMMRRWPSTPSALPRRPPDRTEAAWRNAPCPATRRRSGCARTGAISSTSSCSTRGGYAARFCTPPGWWARCAPTMTWAPLETLVLGQAYVAAGMMCVNLKSPESLTIKVDCSGPIGGLTVEGNAHGEVRGYLSHDPIPVPADGGVPRLRDLFGTGPGTLSITKYPRGGARPFTGVVEIRYGSLAEDLAYYYTTSEQTPECSESERRVRCGGPRHRCGGIFIQAPAGRGRTERTRGGTPVARPAGAWRRLRRR